MTFGKNLEQYSASLPPAAKWGTWAIHHTFRCKVRKVRDVSGDFQDFFPLTLLLENLLLRIYIYIYILIKNLYFFSVSSLCWATSLLSLCCIKAATFILQNPSNLSPVFILPFMFTSHLQQNMCSLSNNSAIWLHTAKEIIQMKNLGFP